uniref:hypothetical protein n=1 Tax=Magnusiomyces suaveolens TaxID=44074 RepID=UPI001BEFE0C9
KIICPMWLYMSVTVWMINSIFKSQTSVFGNKINHKPQTLGANRPRCSNLASTGFSHWNTGHRRYYSNTADSKIHSTMVNGKVTSFDNTNDETVRAVTKKSTRDMVGIYTIYNKTTGNYYIGSSYKDIYKRFTKHTIDTNTNNITKNAVSKYGLEGFKFLITEFWYEDPLKVQTPEDTRSERDKRSITKRMTEQYIEQFCPKYNIRTTISGVSTQKDTEEARQKMREAWKGNTNRTELITNTKGKTTSEEDRSKLREVALKRPPMSEETRTKCITGNKPVCLYFYSIVNKEKVTDKSQFFVYSSMKETSMETDCGMKTTYRAINYHNGFMPTMKLVASFGDKKYCYTELI